jgi:hypothetical protein
MIVFLLSMPDSSFPFFQCIRLVSASGYLTSILAGCPFQPPIDNIVDNAGLAAMKQENQMITTEPAQ